MVQHIQSSIVIDASPEQVWRVLFATEAFPEWNPFIKSLEGNKVVGETIKVTLKNGDGEMKFKPKVLEVEENKKFTWKGKLLFPKIFDGTHSFELIEQEDGTTLFQHNEEFSGLLVWLILKFIREDTKNSFEMMNEAIKQRVEALAD